VFPSPNKSDAGSSIVGFVLVAPLVILMFIAIGQIAMIIGDKAVINSAAVIGARTASAADASLNSGKKAARNVLASKGSMFNSADVLVAREVVQGVRVVRVTVIQKVEISFVKKVLTLRATARAIDERSL
jgi:hypothetical protein